MTLIAQVASDQQIADLQTMLREYRAWTRTLDTETGDAPTFEAFDAELASLPGVFGPPRGRFLMATEPEGPAGCVALKPHDARTGEIKRLYVRPGFRGRRIGAQLVEAAIAEARAIGYEQLVLDSHHSMTAAHAIYRAAGFVDQPPPTDFPARLAPFVVFMACDLAHAS